MNLNFTCKDGRIHSTLITDEKGDAIKGITSFTVTGDNSSATARATLSFMRVPFEFSKVEMNRAGGNPVGTVKYLCGCMRNYFSRKDAPLDSETCQFHGDHILFSRVNARPDLVQIEGSK